MDSTLQKAPEIKHGNWNNNKYVLNKLNLSVADKNSDSDWVKIKFENNEYLTEEIALNNSKIPDVKGMGARDAVYLLEKSGLRVNLIGSGKVVSQSFTPGQNLVKGTTITITLR